MPVYLIYLGVFFALPVLALGLLTRAELRRFPRTILWSVAFVAVLGGPWDWLSVRTGVWRYDSAPTLGIWIVGLPVEEFLGFYVLGTLLIVLVSLVALRAYPKTHPGRRARHV